MYLGIKRTEQVCNTMESWSLNALSFFGVSMNVRQQQVRNMYSQPSPATVRSAAAWLLGSRLRIPLKTGCSSLVLVACCVRSGLCDELITRSDESYRLCVCLTVCDLETSTIRRPSPNWTVGTKKEKHEKNMYVPQFFNPVFSIV
jgi:hypothetical protein